LEWQFFRCWTFSASPSVVVSASGALAAPLIKAYGSGTKPLQFKNTKRGIRDRDSEAPDAQVLKLSIPPFPPLNWRCGTYRKLMALFSNPRYARISHDPDIGRHRSGEA
jgi:hypothetical protein